MSSHQHCNIPPSGRSARAEEVRRASTPADSFTDNNWSWARRLEKKQRIAEAQMRKEEAEAIRALDQKG
jgi:hypothetical protein